MSIEREKQKEIHNLFKSYYNSEFVKLELFLETVKFRHFRFELFSQRVRFERIKDIFKKEEEVKAKISQITPKNAYHTPVKWLNPIYVAKTKSETDIMLSSPLYFDIDLDMRSACNFGAAKNTLKELIEFIETRFGRKPDLLVFSGRKGFHVYYWKWDFDKIIDLSPETRIACFIKERKKLLIELEKSGIRVDPTVTADPYRLMKIPNTLHGKTGLIARPIKDIDSFNPIVDCLTFKKNEYERLFGLDLDYYDTR
jgi:DNA primase catalytic subunit